MGKLTETEAPSTRGENGHAPPSSIPFGSGRLAGIENLARFLRILREDGLLVGTAEAMDAAVLLGALDLAERGHVRESLLAMLAKSPKERRIASERFDSYFVGNHILAEREEAHVTEEDRRQRRIETGKKALPDYGVSDDLAEAYAASTGERREWLRNMLEYAHSGNRNLPLMKEYLKRIATGWLAAEAGFGLEGKNDEDDILRKDLVSIAEDEAPQALRLIEALVRRINLAAERKRCRTGRMGMPDLRQTIHESMRTGGIPAKPIYKKRPRTSRRFLALCDISESMALFSGFALRFIAALGREGGKTRAFVFSEGAMEIGLEDLARFEQNARNNPLWRRGTDIGSALNFLLEARPPVLDASMTLIVLSDAKTVAQPAAEAALALVEERVHSIVWLNPDRRFSTFATKLSERIVMLRSSTLEELAQACAQL